MPPEQREIARADHLIAKNRQARAAMWPVDDETVPAVVPPKLFMILSVDLPVTGLAVGVFVHR